MDNIQQIVAAARRLNPVPLTVIKDINTPLSERRTADKYDVRAALRTIDSRDMVARPPIMRMNRDGSFQTRDDGFRTGLLTYDQATLDSTGAFLIGQLERLDPIIHMPLMSVSWDKDIDVRTDASMGQDLSSYTTSNFTALGTAGSEISWVGKRSNVIPSIGIDTTKIKQSLEPWAQTIDWTMYELEAAAMLQQSIDDQKHVALNKKWMLDLDHVTYVGDSVMNMNGILNHSLLTNTGNALVGNWSASSPGTILADINEILNSVAGTSSLGALPDTLLLAFPDMTLLASSLISTAGSVSVLEWILANNASKASDVPLRIKGRKWLVGTGNTFGGKAGRAPTASNCMFAYTKAKDYMRIPVVPLARTAPQFMGLSQLVTYYGRIGQVELVYPDTVARRSGIN